MKSLAHYQILERIGSGGMGEVYLARDASLDRQVAVKLLRPEFTKSKEHLSRFKQEARAASSLNHPNILTVYEVGQTNGEHFLVTEYIDGVTLRKHLAGAPLEVNEVLETVIQAASALIAAHAAGIVHRDIKPENIMLRRDGYVKVLDFGLAKLVETLPESSTNAEAPTQPDVNTGNGVVIGTAVYMSPEQLRGARVDARTDIWSLGVVIYEMIAGHAPFGGATNSEIAASILNKEPPPLHRYSAGVPLELQRIITKALRKNREERYQTIKDLALDLKILKQELEFDAKVRNSGGREVKGGESVNATGETSTVETAKFTNERPINSLKYFISEISQQKREVLLGLILLLTVAAWWAREQLWPREPNGFDINRLTYVSKAADAAISPDGKYVVYLVDDGGQQSLWVRQVATNERRQIAAPGYVQYQALTFSPDGNYIYSVRYDGSDTVSELYRIAIHGNSQRKLIADVDSGVTFSPDGRRIAFLRGYASQAEDALMVANADGTQARVLTARRRPEFFRRTDFFYFSRPSWSPDGKTIACAAGSHRESYMNVVEVELDGGQQRAVTSRKWFSVGQVTWLKDASGIVITAKESASGPSQIWFIARSGAVRRITTDTLDYTDVSATDNSETLATVQTERLSSVWVVPHGNFGQTAEVSAAGRYNEGVAWTPHGRIVYASRASGTWHIWIMNRDGGDQQQLTFDGYVNRFPAVSRDGRHIVFVSDREGGAQNIWRMDIDGRNPLRLTDDGMATFPHCSPDGWVVYTSYGSGKVTLWKVPLSGGNVVQLTDKLTSWPAVSPDGRLVACTYREESYDSFEIAVIPVAGGPALKRFKVSPSASLPDLVRWTADGKTLTYIETREGISNIRGLPVDGGPLVQLTDFKSDQIFYFDWSSDGKWLACSRGATTKDVVLISNFK